MLLLDSAQPFHRKKGTRRGRRQLDSRVRLFRWVRRDRDEMRIEQGLKLWIPLIALVRRSVDRHRKTVAARVFAIRANASKCLRVLRPKMFACSQFSSGSPFRSFFPFAIGSVELPLRLFCVENLTGRSAFY